MENTPNLSTSYLRAKKMPDGTYALYYIGTRNEVFPNERFRSPSEARSYYKVQKLKGNI